MSEKIKKIVLVWLTLIMIFTLGRGGVKMGGERMLALPKLPSIEVAGAGNLTLEDCKVRVEGREYSVKGLEKEGFTKDDLKKICSKDLSIVYRLMYGGKRIVDQTNED